MASTLGAASGFVNNFMGVINSSVSVMRAGMGLPSLSVTEYFKVANGFVSSAAGAGEKQIIKINNECM